MGVVPVVGGAGSREGYSRSREVVERRVAGETFLVPICGHLADLQQLFILNDVGSWLWEHLEAASAVDDLVAGVVDEFEVDEEPARLDVERFLQELVEAGLAEKEVPSRGREDGLRH
jgi:hypothetical protein